MGVIGGVVVVVPAVALSYFFSVRCWT